MTKAALKEIRPLIAEIVEEKLREILGDPDAGLAIRPRVRALLRKRFRSEEVIPADKVARRLGLKW
jgi:hypothetical protein